jgi:hypothetical protein
MAAAAARLSRRPALAEVITPARLHDLGNLLLAFVMLWAYIAFSQYLITWSGNLPEEIPWYLHRLRGGWEWVGLILLLFHFALPFVLLLNRGVKRRAGLLGGVAAAILALRLADLFWLTAPAFHPQGLRIHWLDLLLPAGLGGLWIAVFLQPLLRGDPLFPLHDPRMEEAAAAAGELAGERRSEHGRA